MQITKNFSLSELTRSSSYPDINNTPDANALQSLTALCEDVLQPLRDLYNQQMRVNSGYRSPELNRKVGGAPSSQHAKGEAVDIACSNPKLLLEIIRLNNIPFDQFGIYSNFAHISYRKNGNNRKQVFYGKY